MVKQHQHGAEKKKKKMAAADRNMAKNQSMWRHVAA